MDIMEIEKEARSRSPWINAGRAVALAIIAVMAVSLSACRTETKGKAERNAVSDAIDSMEQKLPSGTGFVAKFPDKRRHCLFYLNGGHLYKFDAVTKRLDEVSFTSLTEETAIYYNDNDIDAGIREAVLSPDKEYIMLTAKVAAGGSDGKAAQGLYRMNTTNLAIEALAQGEVTREGDMFFVAVTDKATGRQRALLGFDRSGNQLSREKQQQAARLIRPVTAKEEEGSAEETEGHGTPEPPTAAAPAENAAGDQPPAATAPPNKEE